MSLTPLQEAERAVIAAILLEPPRLEEVAAILGAYDIHDGASAHIWRAMLTLRDAGIPIDIHPLVAELQRAKKLQEIGGNEFLIQLSASLTSGAAAVHQARIVARHAASRAMRSELEQCLAELSDAENAHDDEPLANIATRIQLAGSVSGSRLNSGSELTYRWASDIEPREVEWLWRPYLVANKLNLISGDGQVGKTFLALNLCASLSRGRGLMGQDGRPMSDTEPVIVAYANGEDEPEDTLVPRLITMGADMSKVCIIDDIKLGAKHRAWTMQDLAIVERYLKRVQPRFLVIDPIQFYMGPKVDLNSSGDVRPVLGGFANLAAKYRCSTCIIAHHNKAAQGRAGNKVAHSVDFRNTARSHIMVGFDKDDKELRILAHEKMNLAKPGATLSYRIEGTPPQLQWCGPVEQDADDIAAPDRPNGENSKVATAASILEHELAAGPRLSKELETLLKEEHGISRTTFWEARGALKIPTGGRTIALPAHSGNGWVERDAV